LIRKRPSLADSNSEAGRFCFEGLLPQGGGAHGNVNGNDPYRDDDLPEPEVPEGAAGSFAISRATGAMSLLQHDFCRADGKVA
jgi:hypothetical protein